jgi:hypothetical protein
MLNLHVWIVTTLTAVSAVVVAWLLFEPIREGDLMCSGPY